MAVTTNGIYYPDVVTGVEPNVWAGAMAGSIDLVAVQLRAQTTFRWANASARGAETLMQIDSLGYQMDTNTTYRYTGTGWVIESMPRTTYTSTLTSITNGTIVASYELRGSMCLVYAKITLGSGGTVASGAAFSLPQPIFAYTDGGYGGTGADAYYPRASITMRDVSATTTYIGTADSVATSTMRIRQQNGTTITATVPFTWAINDSIIIEAEYRYR